MRRSALLALPRRHPEDVKTPTDGRRGAGGLLRTVKVVPAGFPERVDADLLAAPPECDTDLLGTGGGLTVRGIEVDESSGPLAAEWVVDPAPPAREA